MSKINGHGLQAKCGQTSRAATARKKFEKELCKLNDVNAWEEKKEEVIEWEEKIKDEGIEYGGFYDYLVEHFTKECKPHTEEKPYVKIAGLTKSDSLSEENYICKKIESMADYLLHVKEETMIKENKDSDYPILKAKGNNSLNITRIRNFETLERFTDLGDEEQCILENKYTEQDSINNKMHDTRYPADGESYVKSGKKKQSYKIESKYKITDADIQEYEEIRLLEESKQYIIKMIDWCKRDKEGSLTEVERQEWNRRISSYRNYLKRKYIKNYMKRFKGKRYKAKGIKFALNNLIMKNIKLFNINLEYFIVQLSKLRNAISGEQIEIKKQYKRPIQFTHEGRYSTKFDWDSDTGYYDENDLYHYISYNRFNLSSTKHIRNLIKMYSPLKQQCREDPQSDMKYILDTLDELINNTELKDHEIAIIMYYQLGDKQDIILENLKNDYDLEWTKENLSLRFTDICRKMAKQYLKSYREWFYTYKDSDESNWKLCGQCKERKLRKFEFGFDRTNKRYKSVCKKCLAENAANKKQN